MQRKYIETEVCANRIPMQRVFSTNWLLMPGSMHLGRFGNRFVCNVLSNFQHISATHGRPYYALQIVANGHKLPARSQ